MGDRQIAGPHGPLALRVYDSEATDGPGLVWLHGGGFAFGDLDMPEAHWVGQQLAARGITVVSVGYQLAPQFELRGSPAVGRGTGAHFPVASEEVAAAFEWVHAHAAELGIDPDRLSLGGASAGGNLAAGASLRLRDAGGVQPASVLLAYPTLHAALPEPTPELAAKIARLDAGSAFPPASVRAMNLNYVRDEALLVDPYAFPGGHDLAGLPPTFILNSDHDSLRSSGEAYASELAAAGVDLLLLREPGTKHGHLNQPNEPAATTSINRIAAWLCPGHLIPSRQTESSP